MVLTLTICGLALYTVMSGIIKINTAEKFLGVAAWSFWALVYFLPEMHERYTYMVDILLVLLTFVSRKYLKYALLSCTLFDHDLRTVSFSAWEPLKHGLPPFILPPLCGLPMSFKG